MTRHSVADRAVVEQDLRTVNERGNLATHWERKLSLYCRALLDDLAKAEQRARTQPDLHDENCRLCAELDRLLDIVVAKHCPNCGEVLNEQLMLKELERLRTAADIGCETAALVGRKLAELEAIGDRLAALLCHVPKFADADVIREWREARK